jgi:hypothetical protein
MREAQRPNGSNTMLESAQAQDRVYLFVKAKHLDLFFLVKSMVQNNLEEIF